MPQKNQNKLIIKRIKDLNKADLMICFWLVLSSQYANGDTLLNRARMSREMEFNQEYLSKRLTHLRKAGIITKLGGKMWRVGPEIRQMVNCFGPLANIKKPLFGNDEEDK